MFGKLAPNRVLPIILGLAALFFGLQSLMTPGELIVILNGVYAGAFLAIIIAFHKIILTALAGKEPYDRALVFTLGVAGLWVAVTWSVVNSIYLRSAGEAVPTTVFTAVPRYITIICAIAQVSAPDFGLGAFHGRDRRVLWAGCTAGVIFGAVVVWFQDDVIFRMLA